MILKRTKILKLLQTHVEIKEVLIKGWVKTKRRSKTLFFIEINDGSCLANLQVVANKNTLNYDKLKEINTGSAIIIGGSLNISYGHGQKWELLAKHINMISLADNDFPLQKKKHSNEFLRKNAHLRPRTNKYGAIFRTRSNLCWAIHAFFKSKNFYYVNTPIITASDCEGAGDMFKVTTLNLNSKKENSLKDFFGSDSKLTVSGQLSAEMFALSLGDVYTFGPTFRAENSNTSRHISEFWMLEPEMAFCNIEENINLSEELIKFLINFVLCECGEDLDFFVNHIDKNLKKDLENIICSDFIHLEYKEAISILTKANKNFEFKVSYLSDLKSEHERYIVEEYFNKPVVIFNYPKEIKPFYTRLNSDNKTVSAMDVLVPRIGEIIGGSQREERFDVLIEKMKNFSIPLEKYWWYLDSRRYGTVIHSGFGMGFERLLMLITGIKNIRDVIPFPRTPGNIEF